MAAQAAPEPATIEPPRHFKSAGDFANAIQMLIDAEELTPVDIVWAHRFTPVSGRTASRSASRSPSAVNATHVLESRRTRPRLPIPSIASTVLAEPPPEGPNGRNPT